VRRIARVWVGVTLSHQPRLLHFFSCGINPKLVWRFSDGVDVFEDAKSREFHRAQQFLRAHRILLKQNALKIGDLLETAMTALGAGGRAFKSPRPDRGNESGINYPRFYATTRAVDKSWHRRLVGARRRRVHIDVIFNSGRCRCRRFLP
jgi:hypothetical protein